MYISDHILSDTELEKLKAEHFDVYMDVLKRYSNFLPKLMGIKISFQLKDKDSQLTFHDGNADKIFQELKNLSKAIQSVEVALRKP